MAADAASGAAEAAEFSKGRKPPTAPALSAAAPMSKPQRRMGALPTNRIEILLRVRVSPALFRLVW
jgi:hypothetical protein